MTIKRYLAPAYNRWRLVYRRHLRIPLRALRGEEAIILYTMGKVGSTAIYRHIPPERFYIQLHSLRYDILEENKLKYASGHYPDVLLSGLQTRRHIIDAKRPARFITVVRDPIARNISAFFQIHFQFLERPIETYTLEELAQVFLDRYPHERALNFYDREFGEILGIDVYRHPFPTEQGWQVFNDNGYDVLILKTETPNETKQEAVAQFLGLQNYQVEQTYGSQSKEYGDVYDNFRAQLILPQTYIDEMLTSHYTTHFYTQDERDKIRAKWEARLG